MAEVAQQKPKSLPTRMWFTYLWKPTNQKESQMFNRGKIRDLESQLEAAQRHAAQLQNDYTNLDGHHRELRAKHDEIMNFTNKHGGREAWAADTVLPKLEEQVRKLEAEKKLLQGDLNLDPPINLV
ncbi:MAG: hypothetical protein ACTHXA_12235 [Gulosibacter sp.]|uniref:hypothetical protein n=1 Tax=Gulosibacter sp. TaxID=2817531 RepID=UPI003F8FF9A1